MCVDASWKITTTMVFKIVEKINLIPNNSIRLNIQFLRYNVMGL